MIAGGRGCPRCVPSVFPRASSAFVIASATLPGLFRECVVVDQHSRFCLFAHAGFVVGDVVDRRVVVLEYGSFYGNPLDPLADAVGERK